MSNVVLIIEKNFYFKFYTLNKLSQKNQKQTNSAQIFIVSSIHTSKPGKRLNVRYFVPNDYTNTVATPQYAFIIILSYKLRTREYIQNGIKKL